MALVDTTSWSVRVLCNLCQFLTVFVCVLAFLYIIWWTCTSLSALLFDKLDDVVTVFLIWSMVQSMWYCELAKFNCVFVWWIFIVLTRGGHWANYSPQVTYEPQGPLCGPQIFWPRVGPRHPSLAPPPLVHLLSHFHFLLFTFFHWLYLFSSFVHPFSFYQNSSTPFPGQRS